MKKLLVVSVMVLCGCASPPKVSSSSPQSVVISASRRASAEAQTLADATCGKVGKTARFNQVVITGGTGDFFFDCR